MKDIILNSSRMRVYVNALGAELKGVEMDGMEYLWQGEAGIYPRTSPTLFPIIGRFLSDVYYVGDQAYQMPLNGIVMDRNFTCVQKGENMVSFRLDADERSLRSYPFRFALTVSYTADANRLKVAYCVENKGDVPMPFGVGCHTAYRWPLMEGDAPEDYCLRFEKEENIESFNPFGWRQPFVSNTDVRPLAHNLFTNYTRSITNIQSSWIEFGSKKHGRKVRIHREGFPFLAIWTLPEEEAKLICLEPCLSIHAGDKGCTRMEDREGTEILPPNSAWEKGFVLEFF